MIRDAVKKYLPASLRNKLREYRNSSSQTMSHSQCGEDLIVAFLLNMLCGSRPKRYLDIGANHPSHLSNTAGLYAAGGQGILVEPDPYFVKLLTQERPRDTVLACGVHFSGEARADLYILDSPTLNTFSRQEMERYVSMGHRVSQTLSVELRDINDILEQAGPLDFMNLDVEGLDLAVLQKMNWGKYRPACICVETITYETQREPVKLRETIDLLEAKGYLLYADTFINSIFVDREKWDRHWSTAAP